MHDIIDRATTSMLTIRALFTFVTILIQKFPPVWELLLPVFALVLKSSSNSVVVETNKNEV